MLRLLAVLVLSSAGWSAVTAQAGGRWLTGRVVDSLSGAPVAYANVESGLRSVVADDSGRFRLEVPALGARIAVRRIGFSLQTLDLPAGADTSVVLTLRPLAQPLARSTINAELTIQKLEVSGFYRRMHERKYGTNAGQFITVEEIDRRNPSRISLMFENRTGVKSQRVQSMTDGCRELSAWLCTAPIGPGGCFMTVYYDGMRLPTIRGLGGGALMPTLIDQHVVPRDVAGIEIYTSPLKAPAEYSGLNGVCGVVLLWSK